jgi:hypothetical protein
MRSPPILDLRTKRPEQFSLAALDRANLVLQSSAAAFAPRSTNPPPITELRLDPAFLDAMLVTVFAGCARLHSHCSESSFVGELLSSSPVARSWRPRCGSSTDQRARCSRIQRHPANSGLARFGDPNQPARRWSGGSEVVDSGPVRRRCAGMAGSRRLPELLPGSGLRRRVLGFAALSANLHKHRGAWLRATRAQAAALNSRFRSASSS